MKKSKLKKQNFYSQNYKFLIFFLIWKIFSFVFVQFDFNITDAHGMEIECMNREMKKIEFLFFIIILMVYWFKFAILIVCHTEFPRLQFTI